MTQSEGTPSSTAGRVSIRPVSDFDLEGNPSCVRERWTQRISVQGSTPPGYSLNGGGVEYLFGGFKMELDARYNLGLTNMNGGTNASSVSLENRGWSFTVGLGKLLD